MHDMNKGTGGCGGCDEMAGGWMGHGGHHLRKGPFVIALLLALTVWVGFKARNEAREFDYIGVPVERNVITVNGEGRVVTKPDIATVDLGTTVEKKTVSEAQQENTRVMNELISKLKAAGVDSADIQTTSYSVYPNYDYNNGRQLLRSYSVSQNVHVKIRDLGKVGEIIGMAGSLGANQIGGINFTVDEPEAAKAEARDEAIAVAKAKAEAIAKAAGITLGRILSFSESQDSVPPYFYAKDAAMGNESVGASAPSVEAGSSEFVINVTISYEIL